MSGRRGVGRWGTENSFPVLHLGQPIDSVVVEAFRHLIDPVADNPDIVDRLPPPVLITAQSQSPTSSTCAGPGTACCWTGHWRCWNRPPGPGPRIAAASRDHHELKIREKLGFHLWIRRNRPSPYWRC